MFILRWLFALFWASAQPAESFDSKLHYPGPAARPAMDRRRRIAARQLKRWQDRFSVYLTQLARAMIRFTPAHARSAIADILAKDPMLRCREIFQYVFYMVRIRAAFAKITGQKVYFHFHLAFDQCRRPLSLQLSLRPVYIYS